jgi:hypothetical protein
MNSKSSSVPQQLRVHRIPWREGKTYRLLRMKKGGRPRLADDKDRLSSMVERCALADCAIGPIIPTFDSATLHLQFLSGQGAVFTGSGHDRNIRIAVVGARTVWGAKVLVIRRKYVHSDSVLGMNVAPSVSVHQYSTQTSPTAPPQAQVQDGCEPTSTYCPLRAIPRNFISDLAALCQPAGSPYLAVACSLAPDPRSHLSLADTGKCAIEICSQSV